MTAAPLVVGFDDVSSGPADDHLRVALGPWNSARPVWTYWFPLLCALFPDLLRAVPTRVAASRGTPFAYPIELRFETEEWCAEASPDEPIAVLPPEVERAAALGRVIVVLSIAHEGRALSGPGSNGSALLSRVAELARLYGLPRERVWLVSGNLDGGREVASWQRDRGLAQLPFTFRACEPFSAFVGGCAAQRLRHGRSPVAVTKFRRTGPHAIGWRGTTVSWARAPFPAVRSSEPAPRFGYACLNRMFRPHRWEVLTRLWRADALDQGLVSFPRPGPEELRAAEVDATTAEARAILRLLPLTVDRSARFEDAAFFSENAAFVGLHPPQVLRDCAMEIVTETHQRGCLFVSEKTFKSLLGRGPAVIVGTRGILAYLHSLGVRTWPGEIAERYDDLPDPGPRLAAAVGAALDFIARSDVDRAVLDEARAANLHWLVSAAKPWHGLAKELCDTVHSLG